MWMGIFLSKFKNEEVQIFLEEATVMDPRFKTKIESDAIWERLRTAAVVMAITEEVFDWMPAIVIILHQFHKWDSQFVFKQEQEEAQTLEEEEDQEEVEEEDYVSSDLC